MVHKTAKLEKNGAEPQQHAKTATLFILDCYLWIGTSSLGSCSCKKKEKCPSPRVLSLRPTFSKVRLFPRQIFSGAFDAGSKPSTQHRNAAQRCFAVTDASRYGLEAIVVEGDNQHCTALTPSPACVPVQNITR